MSYHVERTIETTETNDGESARSDNSNLATLSVNIIFYIFGVLLLLLGFRFVLAILGANPSNWFAGFVYDTSHPFVSPFFSLFNYKTELANGSRFEIYTLVAMAVYATLAYGITRLFTLGQRDDS